MTTRTLNRGPRSAQIIPIAAITAGAVLVSVLAVTAFGGFGGGRDGRGNGNGGVGAPPASPSHSPSHAPIPAPTAKPPADPTPIATPVPPVETPAPPVATPVPDEPDGHDAIPIKVDLETVNGADVYVDIVDGTGRLVGAKSGHPAEGQSVGQYMMEVENLDANTLKLTWVDYPIDNALALFISEDEGGLRFVLVQPEPTGPTDSIALDRELILSFSGPVSAADVQTFVQDGLDTPG